MNQTLTIAISILLGSIIIAGAVILKEPAQRAPVAQENIPETSYSEILADFSAKDITRKEGRLLYGNEDAKITIVEFSDLECPFCARLDSTLRQVVDESDGKIVWEHRHLPLPIHSNALNAAYASQCVAEELGNDSFWEFVEIAFNDGAGKLSTKFLTDTALALGIDADAFSECLTSEKIKNIVTEDMSLSAKLRVGGTPFSVIIDKDGNLIPVEGAQPKNVWDSILADII